LVKRNDDGTEASDRYAEFDKECEDLLIRYDIRYHPLSWTLAARPKMVAAIARRELGNTTAVSSFRLPGTLKSANL
jgi:hypothetical protein